MSLQNKVSKLETEGREISSSKKISTKTNIIFNGELMQTPHPHKLDVTIISSIQHCTGNSDQFKQEKENTQIKKERGKETNIIYR